MTTKWWQEGDWMLDHVVCSKTWQSTHELAELFGLPAQVAGTILQGAYSQGAIDKERRGPGESNVAFWRGR